MPTDLAGIDRLPCRIILVSTLQLRYRVNVTFPSTGNLTYAEVKVTWPAAVDPCNDDNAQWLGRNVCRLLTGKTKLTTSSHARLHDHETTRPQDNRTTRVRVAVNGRGQWSVP